MLRQAVILAGGMGTRLATRLESRPKPLVDVLGIPLLERQITALCDQGITSILILVNHLSSQINSFCESRNKWNIDVTLVDDGTPRGTAGAVLAVLDRLDDDFLVIYGDTLFDVDLPRFYAFHCQDPVAAGTLFLHPNDHPADSDIVILDTNSHIIGFSRYPHPANSWLPNMVNAAMYMLRRTSLEPLAKVVPPKATQDFARDLFPVMVQRGLTLRGYVSPEYIKDIGTPARLDEACAALASGAVARASLTHRQRAVFLDRDGTVSEHNGHVSSPDALHVYGFAAQALRVFRRHEFRCVLVTNQPVLARGECTVNQFQQIQAKLETVLGHDGAFFDRLYVCPHHPDRGFAGEVPSLKVACQCRKPEPGMLLRAAEDMNIDLSRSWMIGDSTADLLAARNAGVTSVLVTTGEAGADAKYPVLPDFVCANVLEASEFITCGYGRILDHPVVQGILSRIQRGQDWFITGQARVGKSTLANLLARELRSQGWPCEVIATDRWIRSNETRGVGFLGRHDIGGINAAYREAMNRFVRPVTLNVPLYLRHSRSQSHAGTVLKLKADTVLIWEGVSSGVLLTPSSKNPTAIFLETLEDARRSRAVADLISRGSTTETAQAIYESRVIDEAPHIEELRGLCAYQLDIGSFNNRSIIHDT